MSNKALPATPTINTVQLVALALNTISNDVDREATIYPLVVEQSDGNLKEVSVRETRPQAAFDVVRAVLDAAKSNQDIKAFVYGLTVIDAHFKANESEIKTHCWIALALCRNCEALISENRLGEALDAALEAREYAAVAHYLAVPESVRLPHLVRKLESDAVREAAKKLQSDAGRESAKKHPNQIRRAMFVAWATKHIQSGATPKNLPEIKRLDGFDKTWGTDDTIKKWWRTIPGAPALKSGAATAAVKNNPPL